MKATNTMVVDSRMGVGKTTKIINYINTAEHPVLVLVERQTEVDRIKQELGEKIVSIAEVAEDLNAKRMDCLSMYACEGKHIVSTHQLMRHWDDFFLATVKAKRYELVIDEALNGVLSKMNVDSKDIGIFLDEGRLVINQGTRFSELSLDRLDEDGWCLPTRYRTLEKTIQNKTVYLQTTEGATGRPYYFLIEALRADIWESFMMIRVLTYKFHGSMLKYYLDLNDIPFIPMSIVEGEFGRYEDLGGEKFKDMLSVVDSKLNDFDQYRQRDRAWRGGLTVTWSDHTREGSKRCESVAATLRNFYTQSKRNSGVSLDTFAWTYHKRFFEKVFSSNMGSKKNTYKCWEGKREELSEADLRKISFLPQNLRGTNDWSHKTHMAYLCNTYMDGTVRSFLLSNGVQVDDDTYALSQLIQWLWRGCIRNDEPMTAFVPSKRMRHLLLKWLGYDDKDLF